MDVRDWAAALEGVKPETLRTPSHLPCIVKLSSATQALWARRRKAYLHSEPQNPSSWPGM